MLERNTIKIVNWCQEFEQQAYELLNKHEETSLFLLANLKTYGSKLTEDSYSGDFKCLIKNEKVVAVFALTKLGNLIVQTDRAFNYSEIIVTECLKGVIPLKGVVGDFELTKPIWDCAKKQLPPLKETLSKKELLFRIILSDLIKYECKHEIKHLKSSDYQKWNLLNKAFLQEQDLSQGEDENAKERRFLKSVAGKHWLGLFIDGRLVSIAAFTAHVNRTGLVGGVYTLPAMRKMGLAKELTYQLLLDGKVNKNMNKVILFTREDNAAAVRLYESLGFKRIGYFGLFLGDYGEKNKN